MSKNRRLLLILGALIAAPTMGACASSDGTHADSADTSTDDDASVDSAALDGPGDSSVEADGGPGADTAALDGATDGCPDDMHLDGSGECAEDICVQGVSTCSTPSTVRLCNEDGSAFTESECAGVEICELGSCVEPVCTPGSEGGCEDGRVLVCNSIGTDWTKALCPNGQACQDNGCQAVQPNVLLLVDTSSSMNWRPDGTEVDACVGAGCPPWTYPQCDDPAAPETRLGRVKQALTKLIASEEAASVRFGLQRFPQHPFTALAPDCEGGWWSGSPQVAGDDDFHALSKPFLVQTLPEIILSPFPAEGDTDLAALGSWFDFTEELASTGAACGSNDQCGGDPCIDGTCHEYTDPELAGIGLTPLGKSLFYAGEYLRHFVVVEGRSCGTDGDCGAASYTCVEGKCHDPFRQCRPTVVIAFTDGDETEHRYTDDFFHPRVQAKRLHYGLGCEFDADCNDGATCVDYSCRPPSGAVDEAQNVCDANDVPCSEDGDCDGFACKPAKLTFADPAGEDRLTDAAGNPVAVTVHVVDASNVPGANNLVAHYGGGKHFSVDLADPDALFDAFATLVGDAKAATICGD